MASDREALFRRYEDGPHVLKAALAQVPGEAMPWRPAEGKWSAHEVIVHCADSETTSSVRIRYLVGEASPTISGYDEAAWARVMDYHARPLDLSLRQVESVRAWTTEFIRSLPDAAWARAGRHTEIEGPYTAQQWLEIYAEHLEIHARQLLRNVAAWQARAPGG